MTITENLNLKENKIEEIRDLQKVIDDNWTEIRKLQNVINTNYSSIKSARRDIKYLDKEITSCSLSIEDYSPGDKIKINKKHLYSNSNFIYLEGFGRDYVKNNDELEVVRLNRVSLTIKYNTRKFNHNHNYDVVEKQRRVPFDKFKMTLRELMGPEQFTEYVKQVSRSESIDIIGK